MNRNAPLLSGWRPVLTAFCIWFAHFMLCWAAVEIWPGQWEANAVVWAATAVALLAMGWHAARVHASRPHSEQADWGRRFGHGAIAIATAAVVFNAVPSLVFVSR